MRTRSTAEASPSRCPSARCTSTSSSLDSYENGVARLELHVSSGTYVRAIAEALGGHCVELRRTEIGPFRVDEADPERIIEPEDALARLA